MKKKPISKKTFYFLVSTGSILYIFTMLVIVILINPVRHNFAIDILKSISGFIMRSLVTVLGITITGRVADDYQIGINYKPGLDKDEE